LKRSDRSIARGLNPRIAEFHTLSFRRCERRFCPTRDQGALLFGERGKEVQYERIDVRAEVRDHEWNAMRHEAGNEMDITRQPVKLRYGDRASQCPCLGERCRQLGSPIERIASFAGLDLDEFGDEVEPLALGEP
jgi:hypothetical protein